MGALLTQFMNRFAYTDFHELNADWIIRTMMELINQVENFVSLNAIKYADPIQWNITSQYEKNTIVIDPQTGTAYISVQPVPSGITIYNTDYWTEVFSLNRFITAANNNFTLHIDNDTLTSTMALSVGEWVIWDYELYEVISPIVAGDQYTPNSNIKRITMENYIGLLVSLTTDNKDSIVDAINSIVSNIGGLANLTTVDKSTIVNALNEVNAMAIRTTPDYTSIVNVKDFGAVGDGINDDTTAIQNAIDSLPNGGVVWFPVGVYNITSTIYLGNGRNNGGISTQHCICLKGAGKTGTTGGNPWRAGHGVRIIAKAAMTDVICIDGITHNQSVENITIECENLADNGIHILCCQYAHIENVDVYNAVEVGIYFDSLSAYPSGANGTANNIQCQVLNCIINNGFTPNAICLKLHGVYPVCDTNQSLFENLWLLYNYDGGAGLQLGLADSNIFINVMEYVDDSQPLTSHSLRLIEELNGYPDANVFYNFSPCADGYYIDGGVGNNLIYGLMTGDGGLPPYDGHLKAVNISGKKYDNIDVTKDSPELVMSTKNGASSLSILKSADNNVDYGTAITDVNAITNKTSIFKIENETLAINGKKFMDYNLPYGAENRVACVLGADVSGDCWVSWNYKTNQVHIYGTIESSTAYTAGRVLATLPTGFLNGLTGTYSIGAVSENAKCYKGLCIDTFGNGTIKSFDDIVADASSLFNVKLMFDYILDLNRN